MSTISDILSDAVPALASAGVDSPRLDAELLLAHVLGAARGWLWAHPEADVPAEAQARFDQLLARRLRREPLAYLLGEREFYGRPFFVTPDVLVPRPETELLVEAVARWACSRGEAKIADIGTGSGAIAVTLAMELPEARLFAVDLSAGALAMARRNAERHGVAERIVFLLGDLLAPLRGAGETLDAIVANLPYIAEETYRTLMPEVRDYEPELALRAGDGGLALIRRLIDNAPPLLVPKGLLGLEVGAGQAEAVCALLDAAGWRDVQVIRDYGDIPRHVLAVSPLD